MDLPFTVGQFLEVFENYNEAIYPAQNLFYLLALLILFLLVRKKGSDRIINAILVFFWLWMGVVYHLLFFAGINKAAYLFGGLFILQAILFLYFGVFQKKVVFEQGERARVATAWIMMLFALFLYPLLGYSLGHIYPAAPTFGVPCPTTIFTFGLLLLARRQIPWILLVIPFLWSLVGFSAAFTLGVREDISLLVAALVTMGILLLQKQTPRPGRNIGTPGHHSESFS